MVKENTGIFGSWCEGYVRVVRGCYFGGRKEYDGYRSES